MTLARLLSCALVLVAGVGCGPEKKSSASEMTSGETEPMSGTAAPMGPTEPTTGGTGTMMTTGEPPADGCAALMTRESCGTVTDEDGYQRCAWQPEFARWSEQSGCSEFAGPPRCIPVYYVGDGCETWGCPGFENMYMRDLGDGVVELMDSVGCGMAPNGWQQCAGPQAHPACACYC